MEQETKASEEAKQMRLGLWALGFFALVPLGAVVVFTGEAEDDTARGEFLLPVDSSSEPKTSQKRVSPAPLRHKAHGVDADGMAPSPDHGHAVTLGGTKEAVAAPLSSFAEEDAARLARFDENAQRFDERLAIFEEEKGQIDEASSEAVRESLRERLAALHPGIRVEVTCTLRVCMVGLSSPDPVGRMITRIGPWRRQQRHAATGDPPDVDDANGMRLAFDKADIVPEF